MTSSLAIVIGIGPGLGRALVRKFASNGFAVAFVGRRPAEIAAHQQELRAEGLDVTGFVGDAGDTSQMDGVHERIRQHYGDAAVLIYNAAIIEPSRFVTPSGIKEAKYGTANGWSSRGEPADHDYLMDTFRTNVAGAHHAVQSVVPAMIARKSGSIFLTGGILAFGPWIEWGVTSMGKAALRSMGHSLAKELNPLSIHVSTIAIHGTIQAGTPYDPALIAQTYLDLHEQPREAWSADYHFKVEGQRDGDPDA